MPRWIVLALLVLGCAGVSHTHRVVVSGQDDDEPPVLDEVWGNDEVAPPTLIDRPSWTWEDIKCDRKGCWHPDWVMPRLECEGNRCWMPDLTDADIECSRSNCWLDVE